MIRTILIILVGFIVLIVMLPVLLVERVIIKRISPHAMYRSMTAIVRFAFQLMTAISGVRLTIEGKENIPEGAVLYVPNHRSYFDIIILYSLFKGECGIIGKKELAKIPFLALWMDSIHCQLLDRDNPREGVKTIMAGIETLKSGVSMMIFPEGTRSKLPDMGMLPFHEGSFKLAIRSGCPIVPIALTHTDEIFEQHKPFVRPVSVTVTFGSPIDVSALSRPQQKELPSLVQEQVRCMVEAHK